MSKPDPEFTLAVFCDLSNAFHVINHDILFKKMINYDIRGIAHHWVENYPSEGQQFVEVGGKVSDKIPITIGVPQVSILGPLLYLIYVNDIGNSYMGNILSFADNTILYTSNSNLNELYKKG